VERATPLTLDTLPLGAYNVRVVQPGVTSNEDLVLTSRQLMYTVSVRLQPVSKTRRLHSGRPST
jgi:hypothetical protein